MKIGILTHHYVANYGAFLQAYCLRATIAELFPQDEVRIVDCVNRKHLLINSGGCFRFYKDRETLAAWLQKTRMPRVFAAARKADLPMTRRVYSLAGINELGLDAIVVGSDEVWNYRDGKSYASYKFGCGLREGTRLISYAASVGGIRDFADLPEDARAGLARFAALSARDDNTAAFVRATLGVSPTRVLDPVFLHDVPGGLTDRVRRLTEKPYILFYYCASLPDAARAALVEYARSVGCRLLGAGEYDKLYDEPSIDLTPFEWAEMFRHARHVVTGTFHGAAFSVVNRRNFTVCPNNPTRAEKIGSLLREFGLDARVVDPARFDLRAMDQSPIDYTNASAVIAARARESREYLSAALSCSPV